MRNWKYFLFPGLLAIALGLGACGSGGAVQDFAAPPEIADRTAAYLAPDPLEFSVTPDGEDTLISFADHNPGDYNSDGIVNGRDIFPLALDYGLTTDEAPGGECLDGNLDGMLDGLDLFIVAAHFGNEIVGYNIFGADDPEGPFDTLVYPKLIDYVGCSTSSTARVLAANAMPWYRVAPGYEYAGDADPPAWKLRTGIYTLDVLGRSARVGWYVAEDATEPVSYNIYWDTKSPIDFATASMLNVTEPDEFGGSFWQAYVHGLNYGTDYWFAVRAVDGSIRANEDQNTVELPGVPGAG